MNAKKIMGAVLVALLAAALFVGAGAAEPSAIDGKAVFIYQNLTGVTNANDYVGSWYNGDNVVTIGADYIVIPGANFVAGIYKKGETSIYVSAPTASYGATGEFGTIPYIIANGGKFYYGTDITLDFDFAATSAPGINPTQFQVTYPSGQIVVISESTLEGNVEAAVAGKGTYKVQAVFAANNFKTGVDSDLLVDANAFTFVVVDESDVTISAGVDTAFSGEFITLTIEGTLGQTYYISADGFNVAENQYPALEEETVGEKTYYKVVMPNSGKATVQVEVNTAKTEATIKLLEDDKSTEIDTIKITVSKPVVTATVGATSYFIGDEIALSGTSTSGADLYFSIEGTNFNEILLDTNGEKTEFGKTWKAALKTAEVKDGQKKLDVGTYTINIYQGTKPANQGAFAESITGDNAVKPVKTVAVALKQPFISIIDAPEVVVQGTDVEFIINAEATTGIKAYIFGTNFFLEVPADQITVDKDLKNKFTAELNEEQTSAKNMSAGQYFMVIQHPMYDGKFNIGQTAEVFYLNTSGNAIPVGATSSKLFDVNDRQTANAAQALCDALDTQNIDDMYVKYSFFVAGEDESFTISDIPSQIAKGTTLVISGVDTANAEETVVVEMISTAFAAVPKETVGSAAFIAVTTEVAEDGTWEVTLDTSDLNVDEYSLSVVINDATKKNVKVNVVEAADKPDTPVTPDVPDTPDTPVTPTEPETPGFGALAALAGLGAVAVLLLRRE